MGPSFHYWVYVTMSVKAEEMQEVLGECMQTRHMCVNSAPSPKIGFPPLSTCRGFLADDTLSISKRFLRDASNTGSERQQVLEVKRALT